MQFDLNLFLSTYNFSYECEDSNGLNDVLEVENERIIKRDSIVKDNVRFNTLLYELKYPVKIDNISNIKALLEQYNKNDNFTCNKLVIFGYSFRFNEIEMIKNNIKQVKNFKNIDVKVYTRY